MSAGLDAALRHAAQGWPVCPVSPRRVPLIEDWGDAASTDPAIITAWWAKWPFALIGTPTGKRTGLAVLDIDRKNGKDGFRTLATLGYTDLPKTPSVLTPRGGTHLHFERPEDGFCNTVGAGGRGIGAGLDWRCDGGLVVLPAPGSGYVWGECHYDNCSRLPVPEGLLPRERPEGSTRLRGLLLFPTVNGLSGVLRRLHAAEPGERNAILFWAACRLAEGVTTKLIAEDDARRLLQTAASNSGLTDREIIKTVDSAFKRIGG